MKKWILIFALLLSIPSWGAAPSWVKATQSTSTATSASLGTSFTPTNTGDVVYVTAMSAVTTQTASIASTGWSWNTAVAKTTTTGAILYVFWAYAPSTAAATITVTWSGTNSFRTNLVDEWTGMDTTNPNSFTNSSVGSGGTVKTTVTPVDNDCGLQGGIEDSATAVGAGFAVGGNDAGGDWSENKVIAGGSGVSQDIGFTGSGAWIIGGVAVKPLAAVGGTTSGVSKWDKLIKYGYDE